MRGFPIFAGRQKRANRQQAAASLHGGLVRAALAPKLYRAGMAKDTFEGRATMVTLHTSLLIARLRAARSPEGDQMAEAVNTLVLDGFDASYRETGVGDASIARKMRKLAEAHYGLGKALAQAFAQPEGEQLGAVRACLERNAVCRQDQTESLARYLSGLRQQLHGMEDKALLSGKLGRNVLE